MRFPVKKLFAAIAICYTATFATALATPPEGENVAIFAPKPEYPPEARAKNWAGDGAVLLNVNVKTGRVISVRMVKSTGHKVLDDATLNSYRQWRFKPGRCAPKVICPITFTATGEI